MWVLCFVCVNFHSFGVIIALRLCYWILEFVRKVLKIFGTSLNRLNWLGNLTNRFIRSNFPKQLLGLCIELDEQVPDYSLNVGV